MRRKGDPLKALDWMTANTPVQRGLEFDAPVPIGPAGAVTGGTPKPARSKALDAGCLDVRGSPY